MFTKPAIRAVNHPASLTVHPSTPRMAQQRLCVANLSRTLRTAGLPHSTSSASRNKSQVISRACQQSRNLSTTSPRLAQFKTVEQAKAFNNMGVSFPRRFRMLYAYNLTYYPSAILYCFWNLLPGVWWRHDVLFPI